MHHQYTCISMHHWPPSFGLHPSIRISPATLVLRGTRWDEDASVCITIFLFPKSSITRWAQYASLPQSSSFPGEISMHYQVGLHATFISMHHCILCHNGHDYQVSSVCIGGNASVCNTGHHHLASAHPYVSALPLLPWYASPLTSSSSSQSPENLKNNYSWSICFFWVMLLFVCLFAAPGMS